MAKYKYHEKVTKPATYRLSISKDIIDGLYERILHKMIVEKKYLDPKYTARQMAEELETNVRYVSATVSLRFGMNFATVVNGYRIREALYLLNDRANLKMTMKEVAERCGFASRQTFYATFYNTYHKTPKDYQAEIIARQPYRPNKKK